jgi:hypothetical protein
LVGSGVDAAGRESVVYRISAPSARSSDRRR